MDGEYCIASIPQIIIVRLFLEILGACYTSWKNISYYITTSGLFVFSLVGNNITGAVF